ncbi:hypothetical protein Hanom_Chr07g00584481 [Helianthus anomalus]
MKMASFQTFWIQMQKNKPSDENRKSGQTSGTKMAFYSKYNKGKFFMMLIKICINPTYFICVYFFVVMY